MKNIGSSNNEVVKFSTTKASTGLEYVIGYKTVGNAPLFKLEAVRESIMQLLDERAVISQVVVRDAKVFSYGLSFRVIVSNKLDINRFVSFLAQYLINQINDLYPDLELKTMAVNGSVPRLSRLWHRPYYVATILPVNFPTIADYLD